MRKCQSSPTDYLGWHTTIWEHGTRHGEERGDSAKCFIMGISMQDEFRLKSLPERTHG